MNHFFIFLHFRLPRISIAMGWTTSLITKDFINNRMNHLPNYQKCFGGVRIAHNVNCRCCGTFFCLRHASCVPSVVGVFSLEFSSPVNQLTETSSWSWVIQGSIKNILISFDTIVFFPKANQMTAFKGKVISFQIKMIRWQDYSCLYVIGDECYHRLIRSYLS